ncbi:MAG: DUF962 domain-containing protein, partial [Myxococcota bacterium]
MSTRFRNLDEFWPYYLSEHRDPTTRMLHFLGTSGFIASVLTSLWVALVPTLLAVAFSCLVIAIAGRYVEAHRAAFASG